MDAVLGFLGCGQMGGALLSGWLDEQAVTPDKVWVADPSTGDTWAAERGVRSGSAQAMLDAADVIILAIKPQAVAAVTAPLSFRSDQVVISIAAGLPTSTLREACAPARIVRVMPNVACRVKAGATLLLTADADPADLAIASDLFGAVGHVEPIGSEALFHVGTAVSGSGPAYLFLAMEAMADGAVAAGLPRAAALRLAAHTVGGAGALAAAEGTHPGVLKDRVTSPGGTTIQGVKALEERGFRAALMAAVAAATARSQEMESL